MLAIANTFAHHWELVEASLRQFTNCSGSLRQRSLRGMKWRRNL